MCIVRSVPRGVPKTRIWLIQLILKSNLNSVESINLVALAKKLKIVMSKKIRVIIPAYNV